MNEMLFDFGELEKEIIYDDHGGHYPVCDFSTLKFFVNGLPFTAKTSNLDDVIRIYHDDTLFAEISKKSISKENVQERIREVFTKHSFKTARIPRRLKDSQRNLFDSIYKALYKEEFDWS